MLTGAARVAGGTLELVTLFTVLLLGRECFRPFGDLSKYWHVGFAGLSSSKQIAELLATEPEVAKPAESLAVEASHLGPRSTSTVSPSHTQAVSSLRFATCPCR